ncbi:zinc finger, CCHC-type containing protein [Tanacetum coccineum]
MHFLLSGMSVVYVLTTLIPEDGENATMEQIRRRNKLDNNDYVCRDSLEAKYMAGDASSKKFLDGYKPKSNNVAGPLVVNIVEHNNSFRNLKKNCKGGKVGKKVNGSGTNGSVNDPSNSLNGANVHVCKDRCWFKTYESLNDGSILHMGNESTTMVHGRGHVHYKMMQDMSKDGLILDFDMDTEKCKTYMLTKITKKPFQNIKRKTEVLELIHSDLCDFHATPLLGNKKYFVTFINDAFRFCYVYLLHTKDEALDKFKVFKTEVELQQGSLIKRFRTDRGGEYMDTLYFQSVGFIHETTAPYTPQQNDIFERKIRVLKEIMNSILSYSGLSQGPVVRLPDPKLKTLGKRGIECIFVGYAKHSKAFRLILMIPNGTEGIGGSVVPAKVTEEVVTQQPETDLRKIKRSRTLKNFGPEFQLYLIKGTRDEVSDQHSDYFKVEDDPKTFDEAMKSQDAMPCTRHDIAFAVGKLSVISWASKKQTYVNSSTMETEFVVLVAGGKESELSRNMILEIPLWSKPIAPCCGYRKGLLQEVLQLPRVWKLVRYGVSKGLDMAYWSFLE